ncbi:hypothetical protein O4H52_13575 [Sphingomonadaceae bacterium G21617-S1]|jgi:hypothetical protein|nr:hypothetical protein [Sphingomonadaceae bacterium G21617-S1]
MSGAAITTVEALESMVGITLAGVTRFLKEGLDKDYKENLY